MRTKTLVLTALGSLSAMGLMAQANVYSLNAVGYINVTCNPGFTMISDQLWNNPGTPNYIGTVLPVPSSGADDSDLLYKWTGTGFAVYSMDSLQPSGWDPVTVNGKQVDPSTNVTLNPGEAAFLDNVNATTTFTFVGTVPQGTNTVSIASGFNLISSIVPQSGHLVADLGFPVSSSGSQDGDFAYLFSNSTGYSVYQPDSLTGSMDPSDPTVAVGTGVFYVANGGPVTWTRIFSVNQ